MLLSLRRNYLFVHIAKTGGSSIRSALAADRWRDPWHWAYAICGRISHLSGHRLPVKLPRHAPIVAAWEMLPPETFDTLFKFAVVRNPWDRLVSAFGHLQRERSGLLKSLRVGSFDDFVSWAVNDANHYRGEAATLLRALCRSQTDYLQDSQGNMLVNFVGRFETMSESFVHIARSIRLPGPKLPHKRNSQRRDNYRHFYSDTSAQCVAECYSRDMALFNYHFDEYHEGPQTLEDDNPFAVSSSSSAIYTSAGSR
jgi:hypothetical protein